MEPPYARSSPALENKSQPELHLPGLSGEASDLSRIGVTDRGSCPPRCPHSSRHVQVLDVERVQRFESKLQVPSLSGQRDVLEQGQIHIEHCRPSEHIASEIPE